VLRAPGSRPDHAGKTPIPDVWPGSRLRLDTLPDIYLVKVP